MKKKILLILLTMMTLFIAGCEEQEMVKLEEPMKLTEKKEEIREEKPTIESTIKDYYPFEENIIRDYEGFGNEYAEQKTYVEFIDADKIQLKIENPGTNFVKVLEYKNGELKEVFSEGEFYHIENMLNANTNSEDIILKEPLVVGNNWDSSGLKREITSMNVEVETEVKTFEAMEVTTYFKDGAKSRDYFVKGLGHIKTSYVDKDMKIDTILKKIIDEPRRYEIKSYYPNGLTGQIEEVEREIPFNTNDNVEEILENIMKKPGKEDYINLISDNTNINNIYLDRNNWTVEIDFSKEIIEDINLGASLEYDVLDSIAKTLGNIYDVDKVYIKVDGKEYNSGHIKLNKDEPIVISKK